MLVVSILALTTYELTGGFNLFHGFAIVSAASLLGGFAAIRIAGFTNKLEPLRAHAIFMGWFYFGLVLAGLSKIAYHVASDYFLNSSNANRFFSSRSEAFRSLSALQIMFLRAKRAKHYATRR